ncbi:hypothetical protein [Streptomyces griseoluteus]
MSAPAARPAPTQPNLSEADRTAHELASFVRTVESTPDLPPLPTEPEARRRVMKLRGW